MTEPASTPDPSRVRVRPGSVTVLVVLMWVGVALTLAFAIALLLVGAGVAVSSQVDVIKALVDGGMGISRAESVARVLGPVMLVGGGGLIVLALIQALLAIYISRGSNVARILFTIIIVVRMLAALATLTQGFGSNVLLTIVIELVIDVVLLWLVYNRAAREFFTNRVA